MKGGANMVVATKKYIRNLRERSFMDISQEAEKRILEKLGTEPGLDGDGTHKPILNKTFGSK
jgi:hypothetical protein